MKIRHVLALGALTLAGTAAFADQPSSAPVTRAEVVQSVLAARAAGTLVPAGEGQTPGYPQPGDNKFSVPRSQVVAQVLQARARGELIPAGQGMDPGYPRADDPKSTLTRAEVRAQVLDARAKGELIPAGEGPDVPQEYKGSDFSQE